MLLRGQASVQALSFALWVWQQEGGPSKSSLDKDWRGDQPEGHWQGREVGSRSRTAPQRAGLLWVKQDYLGEKTRTMSVCVCVCGGACRQEKFVTT